VRPRDRAAPGAYNDAESRAVYAELGHRAVAEARERGGAIVDGTFRRAADVAEFMAASHALADAGWILCEAPPEVMLARGAARGPDSVSDADARVVAGQLAVHRESLRLPAEPLARISTTRPVPQLLEELAECRDHRDGLGVSDAA
jgi:predicted kinase